MRSMHGTLSSLYIRSRQLGDSPHTNADNEANLEVYCTTQSNILNQNPRIGIALLAIEVHTIQESRKDGVHRVVIWV